MLSKWCSPINDPGHMTTIMPRRPLMRSLQRCRVRQGINLWDESKYQLRV